MTSLVASLCAVVMLFLLVAPAAFKLPASPLTRRQALLRGVPAAAAAAALSMSPTPALAEFLTLEKAQAQAALQDSGSRGEPFSGQFSKQGMPGGRMFELSSGGISSYQKLQLENGLKELATPAATATGQVKDALDACLATLPRVSDSSIAESDVKRLLLAANELSGLASSGAEGLKTTAESIVTKTAAFEAAIQKKDSKKLAEVAIALADLLTDFAYGAAQEEKPLAPLRNGTPLPFDPDKKRFDMPVSGKTI